MAAEVDAQQAEGGALVAEGGAFPRPTPMCQKAEGRSEAAAGVIASLAMVVFDEVIPVIGREIAGDNTCNGLGGALEKAGRTFGGQCRCYHLHCVERE